MPSAAAATATVGALSAGSRKHVVLVLGGSGLLGSAICRRLVQCDNVKEVVAVTRRGRPRDVHRDRRWAQKVTWESGDALRPNTFAPLLSRCSAVVHSVGMIAESSAARAERSDLSSERAKSDSAQSSRSHSPGSRGASRERDEDASTFYKQWFDPEARDQDGDAANRTFEALNRDTAVLLAAAASECPNIETVVYVSSANMPEYAVKSTLVDERYERSKRDAEAALLARGSSSSSSCCSGSGIDHQSGQSGKFRPVILRPGFMVSDDRPASLVLGAALAAGQLLRRFAPAVTEHTSRLASKARAAGAAPPTAEDIAGVASRVGMEASSATAVGEATHGAVAAVSKVAETVHANILQKVADDEGSASSFLEPLHATTVAEACAQAIFCDDVHGVQDVHAMQELSQQLRRSQRALPSSKSPSRQ